MIREMTISFFEHLVTTTCKGIDKMWIFVEQILKVPYLTKSKNSVLAYK